MKVKNVKVGVRVMLKGEVFDTTSLQKGMTGTIIQKEDIRPFVEWDNWEDGHNMNNPSKPNSSWAVYVRNLKRIK